MIVGLMILLFVLGLIFCTVGIEEDESGVFIAGALSVLIAFIILLVGIFHGFIDYKPSNDKDLARITAVTQEQIFSYVYYKVEVEYLTNTPTQVGVVQNRDIEKDTFYCYYEDEELVNKLKNNMYKELWIISGYKGGYETYKDFGTKLIKDIELKEEN